jgi:8-oxo-dGTP pyrophosphatase MutT (NUDIX family)
MKKRVRAVIIKDGLLLLIHRIKQGKKYWVFPGGGLEDFDASPQKGLERECFEELGVKVEVNDLFMEKPEENQVESFYNCKIISGELGTGKGPEFTSDPNQSGIYEIQKVPISSLSGKNVYPPDVRDKIIGLFK